MTYNGKLARLFSLLLVVALLLSMAVTAGAVDEDQMAAEVEITQTYNGKVENSATHNYATDGDEVTIKYEAALCMTEAAATYLQANQRRLMDAKFQIHVNMEMDKLDFVTEENTVAVTLTSTFLKPQNSEDYNYEFLGYDDATGEFQYVITADKEWAEAQTQFVIPAELITYYDGETVYNYEDAKAASLDGELLYADYTVEDWMKEIKTSVAELRVEDEVRQQVVSARGTETIVASGTIEGTYTYMDEHNNVKTLIFGTDGDLPAWTSNEVSVTLTYVAQASPDVPVVPTVPDSPYLNTEDHYAYIVGYPEGDVRPEGSITRAEVATIFFRMLNDETRSQYWSQTNSYSDVSLNDWYNNAVSTLSNLGILNGYADGTYRPDDPITRAEFATIAVRFCTSTDELTWENDAFSDIHGHWANEDINRAYLLKVINGYPDGTYRPDDPITRAEAMTIVNNTLRRSPVKEGLLPVSEMITWSDNMDTSAWYYEAVQEATNSHLYTDSEDGEQWTETLPVRDWVAFEKAWSNANSTSNPGEVVDAD